MALSTAGVGILPLTILAVRIGAEMRAMSVRTIVTASMLSIAILLTSRWV